jgi:preprotein translocase subunit SecF
MKRIYTILFGVSVALTLASIVLVAVYGLNFGVDFRGGSVLELTFAKNIPTTDRVSEVLRSTAIPALAEMTLSSSESGVMVLRAGQLTQPEHERVMNALIGAFKASEVSQVRFDSIGPSVGAELKTKSLKAIILVLLAVVVYIALVFRAMRRVLSPWVMGLAAIVALAHDVIIPLGLFAWLGHAHGVQISAVFIAAILTILGYSVSDTVVVFDRVRENILRGSQESFAQLVHRSIMQTLGRSINTTLTVLISLIAIYLFGGESIRMFALALIVGIGLGAYSSIFVASPLLVWFGTARSSGGVGK